MIPPEPAEMVVPLASYFGPGAAVPTSKHQSAVWRFCKGNRALVGACKGFPVRSCELVAYCAGPGAAGPLKALSQTRRGELPKPVPR